MSSGTEVYLLGSGSSVDASVPTVSQFKSRAASVKQSLPDEQLKGNTTEGDFEKALDRWDNLFHGLNIEEYYIEAESLESAGVTASYGHGTRDLQHLIAKTIDESTSIPEEQYTKFIRKIWARGDGINPVILSLNWDLVIERTIHQMDRFRYSYGYGEWEPYQGEHPDEGKHDIVFVHKLHGSLNWWYCGECEKLWEFGEYASVLKWWEGEANWCNDCMNELEPLFVPPSSKKLSPNYAGLAQTWKKARETVKQDCEKLTIIGYSFPRADLQFELFFIEALRDAQMLDQIEVVTKPKLGSRKVEFEDRYRGIFSRAGHSNKLNFTYSPFQEWVENLLT